MFPDSFVGNFGPSGRFFTCDRGAGVIGAWDLQRLREHFESLGLDWPLPGLGKPAATRAPLVDVVIDWNLVDKGISEAHHRQYYQQLSKRILRSVFGNLDEANKETND